MLDTMTHSGYNLTEGGKGSTDWKASNETRKKMNDTHIGKVYGPHKESTKQKIRESRTKYKRGKHPKAVKITVDAKQYSCLQDAAEDIGMPYSTFCAKQRTTKSTKFSFQLKGVLTPLIS